MRKALLGVILVLVGSEANAQTSSTNCTSWGSSVNCTTQTAPNWQQQNQQNQQQMNQAFANFGAAIAARRERKRVEKEAAAVAATEAAHIAAIKAALDADMAVQLAQPSDEPPVLLACTINGSPASVALFEKHGRVDTTNAGVTKTRAATFSTESVTWTTPLLRNSLSRIDGSYTGFGNIPEVAGESISGKCTLASKRSF